METRLLVAYGLLGLIAAFALAGWLYRRYYSHARVGARRRRRDEERYEARREASQDLPDA